MDAKFFPAVSAIKAGNLETLRSLVIEDPSLATSRSSRSHPTLLQCLALDAVSVPNKVDMAKLLVDAGAEINGPFIAAASIDNVEIAAYLLDCGAEINGTGTWSPLEEALYWNSQGTIKFLLERGAAIRNLRTAAALGRMDLIKSFFDAEGNLRPEAGKIDWPFGKPKESNLNSKIKNELAMKITSWSNEPQEIINNAFVYAAMHNQIDAAKFLLEKGAQLNAIPPGFDFSGTALHYAAVNGHKDMVDFLVSSGADVKITDTKVNSTPSGWADHGGHAELRDQLRQLEV